MIKKAKYTFKYQKIDWVTYNYYNKVKLVSNTYYTK